MMIAGKIEVETRDAPSSDACWELIERISASRHLRRATRLQQLLLFIGQRSLRDGCDRLQEQEIGSKVFHRPDSYDTSFDNIVRTSVSDLRRRVEAYFNSEGSSETVLMEVPRGSYVPVFRIRTPRPEVASTNLKQLQESALEAPRIVPKSFSRLSRARWLPAAMVAAVLVILLLSLVCAFLWSRYRSLHQSVYAWQKERSVESFWSGIMNSNPDTDVVISDTAIGIVQALSRKQFSLNEYLTRSYLAQLDGADTSQEMHTAMNRILAWNLANPDEFVLARRILDLDPSGKRIHFYNARNYMPDLIKRDNVILIGARKSNPWDELFESHMNFITEFDSPRVINRAPMPGEQPSYENTESVGHCVVAYMPNPDQHGIVLLIEGTNAEATEAAGDFLLSEDQLAGFKRLIHSSTLPYFQVLLKVSAVRGTPFAATIEAYRTFPSLH